MASLKELRARIGSVKSTRKITSAMKMVAAAKLRRAETRAAAARPYADAMRRMLAEVARSMGGEGGQPKLLVGTGGSSTHLLVPMSSDRGLAGAFNSNINRKTRDMILKLQAEGKTVRLLPIGRKTFEYLSRDFSDLIVDHIHMSSGKEVSFKVAADLGEKISGMLDRDEFDVCTLVYNRFQNVMSQVPTEMQLIPLALPGNDNQAAGETAAYEFEPDEGALLSRLLPRNLQVQLYATMLETAAGENGARMTAMDSATRNAGKAIDRLTLTYNRTRQTNITNELIEIISGAQAV
ncbi:F0F1 ATP synthase subunit gamma [Gluconacetobacter entanii]|uniref:ATP synthase gamma chain n=1 Tax=Gluconacetobacter entanii TaxID=108528 RepID=A0A318PXP6_9PROT|nr:F0F1 ATP synthase subunit gamma [Gluconacetobacter entanii]MBE7618326.1 F0F1 ATP synthase subunit gamma [Komagataeibacter sp. FXV2]MCE2578586.1 F0F1 ATP synthase subunit gamma [Komagataeibacter sp. FNDCR1]MBY4638970.1 F0F1 ATP synthase subunit gamma [Gluconacetobacter entanii]MCW4581484.1 F0F1 ATP synthase subunit gamma [Gluconacetobacter entanii]MCW4584864.1 F0F1 ATP synthase subunit gamma [Gluconacetobacter entanii]